MIIQGSNNPLIIKFNIPVASLPQLVVTCWDKTKSDEGRLLKTWYKTDMSINNDTARCPLYESETAAFPSNSVVIEAKGLDERGETVFWDQYRLVVKGRLDRIIKLTQSGG